MNYENIYGEGKCQSHSEFKDKFGNPHSYLCPHKPKFKVEYRSGITGEHESRILCGVHTNGIKKWAERIKKKTGWEAELKITKI